MVFDWNKAAQIIKERGATNASAGLSGDWEYTGGTHHEGREAGPERGGLRLSGFDLGNTRTGRRRRHHRLLSNAVSDVWLGFGYLLAGICVGDIGENFHETPMTPADLRAITISLNDERGTGGQSKLARLLDWDYSTLWRKLNGNSRITTSDELAIRQAIGGFRCQRVLAIRQGRMSVLGRVLVPRHQRF